VLPQHTDHAGVLWHGAYVAWLEEARVEALAAAGMAYADLSAAGLELMVVGLQLNYPRPLLHGQLVELRSWLGMGKGLRLPFHTQFVAADGAVDRPASACIAAEVRVALALVDRTSGRPCRRMPEELRPTMTRLTNGPFDGTDVRICWRW
jgi:acyl-CoA thioester hydrolase